VVKVFAPVNIAWIKYMGKELGRPTNASLSMTLADVGTTTSMNVLDEAGELHFVWSPKGYVPPVVGLQKAEAFLKNTKIWKEAIERLGYPFQFPNGIIEIETFNSVPAGTGVATSASGFAALTLTWLGLLLQKNAKDWQSRFESDPSVRARVAELASLGSGSACRSFDGPFVEWDPRSGTRKVEAGKFSYIDFILLLDEKTKAVSSSDAHALVVSSPRFSGRVGRAHARLAQVKEALKKDELNVLSKVVLEEALDMHELFHTSEPAFTYLNEASKVWIKRFQIQDLALPSSHAIATLDAGANLHVFVPESEEKKWQRFFSGQENLKWIQSKAGNGARYVEYAGI
jgi:diphosphomevalonate decarboxylase